MTGKEHNCQYARSSINVLPASKKGGKGTPKRGISQDLQGEEKLLTVALNDLSVKTITNNKDCVNCNSLKEARRSNCCVFGRRS